MGISNLSVLCIGKLFSDAFRGKRIHHLTSKMRVNCPETLDFSAQCVAETARHFLDLCPC